MAGGWLKTDPKTVKLTKNGQFLEKGPEYNHDSKPTKPPLFSLKGILGLGQTVELNKQKDNLFSKGNEVFNQVNHLQREEQVLMDARQKELERTIEQLRLEISKLVKASQGLDKQVEIAAAQPTTEASQYQVRFLDRLRVLVRNFRLNISEAGVWLEAFSKKKKKKNFFWTMAKDKKRGGQQYMFSDEHSVARSVG